MPDPEACHLCQLPLAPGTHYVVRIEVFADPAVAAPAGDGDDVDYACELASLVDQMSNMSADELQDGVHRRFEYRVCAARQRRVLANPLGLPRTRKDRQN